MMMRGFDSIESMNADTTVLVKRRRGNKRFMVGAIIIGGLFFLVGILIGFFSHAQQGAPEPTPPPPSLGPLEFILEHTNEEAIAKALKQYLAEPYATGASSAQTFAHSIQTKWLNSGLDQAYISSHTAFVSLANHSNPNKVEVVDRESGEPVFVSQLTEPSLRPDEEHSECPVGFNAFSPAGDVIGDAVYANYGRPEDFEFLKKNLSVDPSGKIAIIRQGLLYSGNKVRNAQDYGAVAVIFYPDPADFDLSYSPEPHQHADDTPGGAASLVAKPVDPISSSGRSSRSTTSTDEDPTPSGDKAYPQGWWLPSSGVKKDALKPASWKEDSLAGVPSISISFDDAASILRNLSGPTSPATWHGTLPVPYRVGPGFVGQENATDLQIRVLVTNYVSEITLYNVIGVITGRTEPDRYVLLGSNHDRLSEATVDALSGAAALDHLVHIFGELLKQGTRPRRTLLFCSWDGGEQGHLGSSTWLQENSQLVTNKGVAYLNTGVLAAGNFTLRVATSPLLQDSLYEAAQQIPSPDEKFGTLYNLWLGRPLAGGSNADKSQEPEVIYSPGGLGDFSPFYHHAGIAVTDIRATSDSNNYKQQYYPLHHTAYDSLYAFEHYHDPGYKYSKALTQLWGIHALNLANSPNLPMHLSRYAEALKISTDDLVQTQKKQKTEWDKHNINTDDLVSAVTAFDSSVKSFEQRLSSETDLDHKPLRQRMYNDMKMNLERMFISHQDLALETESRHVVFGPMSLDEGTGVVFPEVHEALLKIDQNVDNAWSQLQTTLDKLTQAVLLAAKTLEESPEL